MTLFNLVASLAQHHRITKKKAQAILVQTFQTIAIEAFDGRPMRIPGFGTFSRRRFKARWVRSPTGQVVNIPAQLRLGFRPGKTLKGLATSNRRQPPAHLSQ